MNDAHDQGEVLAGIEASDDEYAAVGIPLSWAGAAYLILAGLVAVNLFGLVHYWQAAVATVPGLLLTFLLALAGLKWDRNRAAARFAALVSGVLLALILVPFVSFMILRSTLR